MIPSQFQAPQRSPTGPPSRNSQSPHHYRGEPTSSSVAPAASSSSNTSSVKRSSSPPLDLSSSQQIKRQKIELSASSPAASPPMTVIPSSAQTKDYSASTRTTIKAESPAAASSSGVEFPRHCRSQNDEISSWTVDDVGNFVSSIDICAEYAQVSVTFWIFLIQIKYAYYNARPCPVNCNLDAEIPEFFSPSSACFPGITKSWVGEITNPRSYLTHLFSNLTLTPSTKLNLPRLWIFASFLNEFDPPTFEVYARILFTKYTDKIPSKIEDFRYNLLYPVQLYAACWPYSP